MGSEASRAGEYTEPELPDGVAEVRLSIYKLKLTGLGPLDEIGSGMLGTYHSGLVVAGEEWAFGGHDQEGISGVYTTTPELNSEYSFYQRLVLGTVQKSKDDIQSEILNLAAHPRWAGPRYDLTQRNCNHFASDACWLLLKKRPPEWINKTADGIAQQTRIDYCKTKSSAEALYAYSVAMAPGQDIFNVTDELPGETAFKATYSGTFTMAWDRGWDRGKHRIAECSATDDPEEIKASLENSILEFAAAASEAAAWAVAAGARRARTVRSERVASGRLGIGAWDDAWKNASAPLVAQWREQALQGTLSRPPAKSFSDQATDGSENERMQQVANALAIAEAAADRAAAEAKAATAADPSLQGYHR